MFTYFKKRRDLKAKAKGLYQEIVARARLPIWYESYGVPDSVDGRFEMIALHCYLLMRRLQARGNNALSQKLFDVFFVTMDRSLREMGVGDLGVPKHMKRMMQGFNGRANHYEVALQNNNMEELKTAISKNIYGTVEKPKESDLVFMANYIMDSAAINSPDAVFAGLDQSDQTRRSEATVAGLIDKQEKKSA